MQQHIAASKGKDHCVALLLEHGANPNIKGTISAFGKFNYYWKKIACQHLPNINAKKRGNQ